CWGRRPTLLVPQLEDHASVSRDWKGVLIHELAHWTRRDHLAQLLGEVVACLVPWNPFAWFARRRLSLLSEQSCDDWALTGGSSVETYAESLLAFLPQWKPAFALATVTNRSNLQQRLRHILTNTRNAPNLGRWWSYGASVAAICVVAVIALAQAIPSDSVFPLRGPGGEFLLGSGRMHAVAISPDGKYFLTGGLTGMHLWDYETGEIIRSFLSIEDQVEMLCSLSFSSDGTKILAIEGYFVSGPASVWDVASGERLCTIDSVNSGAFSPDGSQVAVASWGGYLRLCDSQTGEVIRDLQLQKGYVGTQGVAYSPDGDEVLIAVTEGTIVWDPSTGGILRVDERFLPDAYFEGTQVSGVMCAAVSHDGGQYVTFEYAGAFKWETTAILRDLQTGETVRTYGPYSSTPQQASFSPDDSRVLIISDCLLQIWDLETNAIDMIGSLFDYSSTSAVFSPDGGSILARMSRFSYDSWFAAILDSSSGEIQKRYRHITAIALAFSPDGKRILTAGREASVYEWDAETGELLHSYNDFGNITGGFRATTFSSEAFGSVCFSPDGTKILAVVG
ncbi:MAG: M56 family metallopeptidase, partial [bacterium]